MNTIFIMTCRELYRKKALLLTLILVAVHLTCYGLGLKYGRPTADQVPNPMVMYAINAQLMGFAIYTASYISAFFAIFAASGAIATEVENGLLHSIVPKPISRQSIFLGKFLGFSAGCVLFNILLLSAIIAVTVAVTGQRVITEGIIRVYALFAFMPMPLIAVTMLASVYLPAITADVAGAMAFMVSITGGMIEQIGKIGFNNDAMVRIGMATNMLAPMDALYRVIYRWLVPATVMGDMGPFGAASAPREWMVAYAAVYTVVILAAAVNVFARKDL